MVQPQSTVTLPGTASDFYVRVPHDYCLYRNGLTCGGRAADHPQVAGPEGAHEFVGGAKHFVPTLRAELTEAGWREKPTPEAGWQDAFTPKTGSDRLYADPTKPGRRDSEGVEWWACDPYPTWYRWDTVEGERKLRTRSSF